MNPAAAAVLLILLHGPDGHEIWVNPEEIVSLRPSREELPKEKRTFTDTVKCLVNLTDGKYVTVVESCEAVQKMLEEVK